MSFFAYIDPGSGLLVWQVLVAIAMGLLFYLKRVRSFFVKVGRKISGRDYP